MHLRLYPLWASVVRVFIHALMWLVIKKTLKRYLMLMAKLGKKKKEKKKIVMIMLVMIEATDVHLSSIRPTASVASAWSKLYIPSAIKTQMKL